MRFKDMDEERKKIDELAKAHQNLRLEGENYLIRPFQNMAEIEREGELLHHAIAYYAIDRYTKGKDYLFTMRKVSEPDTPFISLEFSSGGKLEEARKNYNRKVTDREELEFIQRFHEELLWPFISQSKEGVQTLLSKRVYDVPEYRRVLGIPPQLGMKISSLTRQLAKEVQMCKEYWWCNFEDLHLLKLHAVDGILRVAIVTDGEKFILCEIPPECTSIQFMEI